MKKSHLTLAAIIPSVIGFYAYYSSQYDLANHSTSPRNSNATGESMLQSAMNDLNSRTAVSTNKPNHYIEKALELEEKDIVFYKEPLQLKTGKKLDLALDRFLIPERTSNPIYKFSAVTSLEDLHKKFLEVANETGFKPLMVSYLHDNLRVPENMHSLSDTVYIKTNDKESIIEKAKNLGLTFVRESLAANEYLVFQAADSNPISALNSLEDIQKNKDVIHSQLGMGRFTQKLATVNDPHYRDQWHLKNTGQANSIAGVDSNVEEAWDHALGEGVVIGIVDDGMEHAHPDLRENLTNFHIDTTESLFTYTLGGLPTIAEIDADTSPTDDQIDDNHGTAVAGVAAARGNNLIGGSGAAPYAQLSSIRIGFGFDGNLAGAFGDEISGLSQAWEASRIHIKNNSWGRSTVFGWADDDGIFMDSITLAGTTGRGGLGTIITKAAGNSRGEGNQCAREGWQNSPYVIPVVALTSRGGHTSYSDFGPHIVVGASSGNSNFSNITTTDRSGALGYNTGQQAGDYSDLEYTNSFSGTSSACPLVSGCIALMLEANPALTYRDVKEILLRTGDRSDIDPRGWVQRGGNRPDLSPIKHHHDYGGGGINAGKAVAMAKDWLPLGPEISLVQNSVTTAVRIPAFGPGHPIVFDFSADPAMRVEHIMINIPNVTDTLDMNGDGKITDIIPGLTADYLPDLDIQITDPHGNVSVFNLGDVANIGQVAGPITASIPATFIHTSVRHWGASSKATNNNGQWVVRIKDAASNFYLKEVNKELVAVDLGILFGGEITLTLLGTSLPNSSPSSMSITGPANFDFGPTHVGNDVTRSFSITNSGGNPIYVESVGFSDNQVFRGSFTGLIQGGTTRNFDVTFSPESVKSYTASMSLKSNAELGLSAVELIGSGITSPVPTLITPPATTLRSSSIVTIPITSEYAVSFSATGLPRGLSIDKRTGTISGICSTPGTYNVKVVATNPWGNTTTSFSLVISPFAASLQGDYVATISRSSQINSNFGGLLQLKVTGDGACSGALVMGRHTMRLRGIASGDSSSNPKFATVLNSPNGSTYRLNVEFMPDQSITGTLSFQLPNAQSSVISGWRNSWNITDFPNPGVYNHRISLAADEVGKDGVPQGHGFYSQTISQRGKIRSLGLTSDGQRITFASELGFARQYASYNIIHSRNGVIQTQGSFTGSNALGTGYMFKLPYERVGTRLYASGYGVTAPVELVTSGGFYTPPTATTAHLGKTPGAENATISFAHANIGTSATPTTTKISLLAGGIVQVPTSPSTANPAGLRININPRSGIVTGSLSITDPNRIEPWLPYVRRISFTGIVEPSTGAAYGTFLLNQLPPLRVLPIPLNRTNLQAGSWILQ